MKILVLHNEYQQYGGEDAVVNNETKLLRSHDHEVYLEIISNHKIKNFWSKILAATDLVFSLPSYFWLKRKLSEIKPDIVHVHNFFPLYSPSIFYACKSMGIPVVFTLHNYRILCPTALLMFDSAITEESIKNGPWWAIQKKVYRNSFFATFLLTFMIAIHRKIGTWNNIVDQFIVLTDFARKKFASANIPIDKISIKSNFIDLPDNDTKYRSNRFLYVGRISSEKGIMTLSETLKITNKALNVTIVGDGPLLNTLDSSLITLEGKKKPREVFLMMKEHFALVMPSIWYEGFPMTLVEAYANSLPVIASRIGALEELVEHGVTGLLFEAGNANDLRKCMEWALDNPDKMYEMGINARKRYEELYTAEKNYAQLIAIYEKTIASVSRKNDEK
ncbi:glycosyltransferase family 4 protein [Acinetobacter soli]|uniref:glycosyltransferase family 4 protein n=1 Tax=Acinetobacter soli TaxID=487316 RepID=UPI001ABCF062|nr:glycosyltransferase family 4 protein [Acinetobacter soli]MBO3672643.1 glycosyltransferase family 4 protein [Acinetobacter soli]